jgi:Transcriptional activator of glycolytic enzymes
MSGPTNQVLMAQNNILWTQVTEILTTMRLQHDSLTTQIFHLKRTVGRFANRLAQTNSGFFAPRRAVPSGGGSGNSSGHNSVVGGIADNAATLSKCPKNLYLLWEEYEFGLHGRKPAKRFTTRERGQDRFKYNRRKIVWDQISKMIRQGHSYLTAINVLYQIYRDNSVTDIINKMRTDRINGGHPELV